MLWKHQIELKHFVFFRLYMLRINIKKVYISKNYIGLMSWLIDRAFLITPNSQMGAPHSDRKTNENKALLLKVLYDINPQNVLQIFSKNA